MTKDKTLENMVEELLKSIENRNEVDLSEKTKKELKENLEKHFKFVKKGKEAFLGNFNPWQKTEGKEIIRKFIGNVGNPDSTANFSWLEILDKDKQWKELPDEEAKMEIKNKSIHVNMHYQIPTHFHGDIDNAVIFHCMENPRGYLGDYKDSYIDKGLENIDLGDYFGKTYTLLNKDNSSRKTVENIEKILNQYSKDDLPDVKEIIKERYQLDKDEFNDELIANIIYSDQSNLSRELKKIFNEEDEFFEKEYNLKKNKNSKNPVLSEKYYYLAQYYAQLLKINGKNLSEFKPELGKEYTPKQNNALQRAEKICNLEIYPFSCADPDLGNNGIGKKILLNSNLSRLGAYIVLRRIYKYLKDCENSVKDNRNEPEKPGFVFRKYDGAWKILFKELFEEVGVADKFLECLEDHFFYCQPASVGGGITSGNVISVRNFRILQDVYAKVKEIAFNEIDNLLPRISIDKDETNY